VCKTTLNETLNLRLGQYKVDLGSAATLEHQQFGGNMPLRSFAEQLP
jgi:hypothetical protein